MKGYNNSIRFRSASLIFTAVFLILFSAGAAFCQELTIPYVFSPGNVISSFEMNENFRVLADKANSLDSVINNLDASNSFWGYDSGTLTYSGGDVGIGTASPVNPFTVEKNDETATGAHILASFTRGGLAGNNGGVGIGYYADGSTETAGYIRAEDDLPLMLGTVGTPQALTITNDGKVGIGTSPSCRLQLNIDNNGNILSLRRGAGINGIDFYLSDVENTIESDGKNFYIGTADERRLFLKHRTPFK